MASLSFACSKCCTCLLVAARGATLASAPFPFGVNGFGFVALVALRGTLWEAIRKINMCMCPI